ncbi:YggT family protein [Aliikangiella sp. G2MR2-5]|uniref:YggT family protein n=1 Tax=Aliikangiella sp. G2MR2-5 TaxID=2788943 RepID=UPI0018AB2943|nr:YggT family protein [Aliikangiella sp. G2MR2-5]
MNPFAELTEMLISLYVSVILLRFFLQYFRADYYNPMSQFVVKITDPLVKPARRIVPGYAGIDFSTLLVAWLVMLLKLIIIIAIQHGTLSGIGVIPLLLVSIIKVFEAAIGLYIFLIFVRVILSWVAPAGGYNPVFAVIGQLTEPLMSKVRGMLPPMGGFDLSPMLLLIGLYFLRSAIAYYLYPLIL